MSEERPEQREFSPPSKSQRKREARSLFELGRSLVRLDNSSLARLPLPAELLEKIREAQAIKSHIAHKRQLQFIARHLRGIDPGPIQQALESLQQEARQHTLRHHLIEAWRDRLLDEGDDALTELMQGRDMRDLQSLRRLIRQAHREAERGKAPAAARKLFRMLREFDAASHLPAP